MSLKDNHKHFEIYKQIITNIKIKKQVFTFQKKRGKKEQKYTLHGT